MTSLMCYSNEHLYHSHVSFRYNHSDIFYTKNNHWFELWFWFDTTLKTSFHRLIQNLSNYLLCRVQKSFKHHKNHVSIDFQQCIIKICLNQYWYSKALHRSVHSYKLIQESYSFNAEIVKYVYKVNYVSDTQ
jgi:hypothetical protein